MAGFSDYQNPTSYGKQAGPEKLADLGKSKSALNYVLTATFLTEGPGSIGLYATQHSDTFILNTYHSNLDIRILTHTPVSVLLTVISRRVPSNFHATCSGGSWDRLERIRILFIP